MSLKATYRGIIRFSKEEKLAILMDKIKTKRIGEISSVLLFDDKLYVGVFYGFKREPS